MKYLLATLGILTMGAGAVNAATFNPRVIPDQAHTIAGERVELRQVGNVAEGKFPWKGERGVTVRYDMGEPSAKELALGRRDKEVVTTQLTDGFKVDILLNEKPNTNVFCYDIVGHEDYDFFYQPQLTQAEIDEGAERPANVVGSYAVYHKTLKNHKLGGINYETGKFMHIYRPEVWEVNEKEATREWAELSYNNGQLCVTARQEFLNNANYPVHIDPTFGYTSDGASNATIASQSTGASTRTGGSASLSEEGTLDSLHVTLSGAVEASTANIFLNTENTATDSHPGVASIEESNTLSGTKTSYTFEASSEALATGNYIFSVSGDASSLTSGAIQVWWDSTGGGGNIYNESFTGGSAAANYAASKEDPWTEPEFANARGYSIYATYSTTPAETTVTPITTYSGDIKLGNDIIVQ